MFPLECDPNKKHRWVLTTKDWSLFLHKSIPEEFTKNEILNDESYMKRYSNWFHFNEESPSYVFNKMYEEFVEKLLG